MTTATTALSLPAAWQPLLQGALATAEWAQLQQRLDARAKAGAVILPPPQQRFAAFAACPPDQVKVVVVGQDPYHARGQAHGLSFSVPSGVKIPPSLRNIFTELQDDTGLPRPDSGDLTAWAAQGVLLLNAVLTVEQGAANSHQGWGWEPFTDAVLAALSGDPQPKVFILWGSYAAAKAALIDSQRHALIISSHPSPLSARRGFFGSKPFSRANQFLLERGREAIDWQLPATQVSLF